MRFMKTLDGPDSSEPRLASEKEPEMFVLLDRALVNLSERERLRVKGGPRKREIHLQKD